MSDEIAFVIDDSELHIPTYSPICSRCRHENLSPIRTCAAFPDGIPKEQRPSDAPQQP